MECEDILKVEVKSLDEVLWSSSSHLKLLNLNLLSVGIIIVSQIIGH